MFSKFLTTAAAATLALSPIAAQAADRVGAPVSESEELRGGFLLPAVIALGLAIAIFLAIDSEDEVPVSA
jgi:hypothetical protein